MSESSGYIRRHWRKNPSTWMGGYVAPAAVPFFDRGLLLPNYIPPVRNDGFNAWANSTHTDWTRNPTLKIHVDERNRLISEVTARKTTTNRAYY